MAKRSRPAADLNGLERPTKAKKPRIMKRQETATTLPPDVFPFIDLLYELRLLQYDYMDLQTLGRLATTCREVHRELLRPGKGYLWIPAKWRSHVIRDWKYARVITGNQSIMRILMHHRFFQRIPGLANIVEFSKSRPWVCSRCIRARKSTGIDSPLDFTWDWHTTADVAPTVVIEMKTRPSYEEIENWMLPMILVGRRRLEKAREVGKRAPEERVLRGELKKLRASRRALVNELGRTMSYYYMTPAKRTMSFHDMKQRLQTAMGMTDQIIALDDRIHAIVVQLPADAVATSTKEEAETDSMLRLRDVIEEESVSREEWSSVDDDDILE